MKKQPKRVSDRRGRKDHYVPQGYLRGFVDPAREGYNKPLWVFDVTRNTWFEKSPSQIGFDIGFYDYSEDGLPDATADEAFSRFENQLPQVRQRIRTEGYESWVLHRPFLVSFAAMMAARSPLFRTQVLSAISPSLADGANRDALGKNFSITLMRSEIQRRAAEWEQYDWVLAYSSNPEQPFVTSDQAVGMRADGIDQRTAWEGNDFWLWCALSWDMCLVGSSLPLRGAVTAAISPEHLFELQILTMKQAAAFVAGPCVLRHLSAASTTRSTR